MKSCFDVVRQDRVPAAPRPDTPELVDTYGRTAKSLRISVTDRCDLRCTYCMPARGVKFLPKLELLSLDEYVRLVRVAALAGVTKVRITGGEPLLYPELDAFIARVAAIPQIEDVALTTNGIGLPGRARRLRELGLDRINVSLDTLDRESFRVLTRRDKLPEVHRGLEAAAAAGFAPIKVNAVVIRGFNDEGIARLAGLARDPAFQVRFIEYMPLDAGHEWERAKVLPAREILARIQERWPLVPLERADSSSPAELYRFADGEGTVGVIASVTRPFCGTCDRIRISANGRLRTCLFSLVDTDLRAAMRGGEEDAHLVEIFGRAVWGKWEGHAINTARFVQPEGGMSYFGG